MVLSYMHLFCIGEDKIYMNNNIILTIINLFYSYGKDNVLSDISMEVEKNSIVFLMGNNGSGKTTLLKCIMNYLQVVRGKNFV